VRTAVLWDVTLYDLLDGYQSLGGTLDLILGGGEEAR
jgi:hypothetical protein